MSNNTPPYTHTVPTHGPWTDCVACHGSGAIFLQDENDMAVCSKCRGEGGWFEPLPPPSYTITDVYTDNEVSND